MIVCHCHRVTDRIIRECVRQGCADLGAVARTCGAGTKCGGCAPHVEDLVDEELSQLGGLVSPAALGRRVA